MDAQHSESDVAALALTRDDQILGNNEVKGHASWNVALEQVLLLFEEVDVL